MPPELTMENLFKELVDIKTQVAGIKEAEHEETPDEKKARIAMEEKDDKDAGVKRAQEDKDEDEKMQAKRARRDAAIKRAMDEDDHDKKEAMIKSAMEEYDKKEGMDNHDKKHEATDEEKEKDAQIASIINEKKNSFIKQILTANRIINPNGLREIEARLKTASIRDVEKEYNIVKPFISGVETPVQTPQQPVIPYFANITPAEIDANQLSAASPDSEFAKLSTSELLGRED